MSFVWGFIKQWISKSVGRLYYNFSSWRFAERRVLQKSNAEVRGSIHEIMFFYLEYIFSVDKQTLIWGKTNKQEQNEIMNFKRKTK